MRVVSQAWLARLYTCTSMRAGDQKLIPSEARFLLGTQSRSYGFKVYVANLKKVALAHYRHSGSLVGSNNVNSCYFSSSRLPVALVLYNCYRDSTYLVYKR